MGPRRVPGGPANPDLAPGSCPWISCTTQVLIGLLEVWVSSALEGVYIGFLRVMGGPGSSDLASHL